MHGIIRNILTCAILLSAAGNLSAEPHKDWKNSLKPKGVAGPELTLASDGKANYTILLPTESTTQEQKAADDLVMWLKEMTGVEFPVVRENEYQSTGKEISLGRTALLAGANIPEADADLGNEGYAIAQRGETLYLFGGKTRGPIYAVYALLEEDLGCRWYDSSRIHKKPSVDIPRRPELRFSPVPRHFVPVLEWRDPFYFEAFDGTWSLRNRTNSPHAPITEEWGGCYRSAGGMFVHTYNRLVPPNQYFGEHPEYFSEHGGKRSAVQLCLTNPDVLRIVISKVQDILKNDPNAQFISVSPNDGTGYCECEKCKAIDDAEGTKAGTLIGFVNAVADAIKDEYPAVKVSTLAYLGTFKVPKTVKPRDNVAIQFCFTNHWGNPYTFSSEVADVDKTVKEWARIAKTIHIWDYTTNFGSYPAVYPNFPVVAPDCRYYIENKARGIMLQGAYSAAGGDFSVMRSWVWAKQLWDPSLDTRELMRDFIYGYYGQAAEPIWKYHQVLLNKWEVWHRIPQKSRPAHPLVPTTAEYWAGKQFISTDLLKELFPLLEEAVRLADDPETKRRARLAKLSLTYTRVEQGLYVRAWDYFSIGTRLEDALLGSSKDTADYAKLIDEIEEIVKSEGIAAFGEQGEDIPTRTRHWREMLEVTNHPRLFVKLNAWKFKADPADVGLDRKWYSLDTDDADWARMRSDLGVGWEKQGFADYSGVAWYRQRFRVPDEFSMPDSVFVLFFGVGGEADIYVNGEFAFLHKGKPWTNLSHDDIWASPFGYDIKKWLKPGKENVIAVRVEHQKGVGGIWMPVYLIPGSVPKHAGD